MTVAGAGLSGLEVEIAESAVLFTRIEILYTLRALRRPGVTVTIDGFGAGHTQLASLGNLLVDRVKLAAAIVQRGDSDPAARVVASSTIGLIRGLGEKSWPLASKRRRNWTF